MEEIYDIVIIGSGLGGLLCAVFLAKEGKKVAIVEQNKQLGGCLQTFSFDKTMFDSCVHYIGAIEAGQTQNKIFQYAGIMDDLNLTPLEKNGFDQIIFNDHPTVYPQAQGFDNFEQQLSTFFPEEKNNIKKYLDLLQHTANHFPLYNLELGNHEQKYKVTNWEVQQTIASISDNKLLQSVLTGNNILYAGQKGQTPFYIHALILKSYIDSAYKFEKGSSEITKLLIKQLRKLDAHIFKKEKVTHLTTKNGRIEKAITATGKELIGRQFIANIPPEKLLELLEKPIFKPAFQQRIIATKNTVSSFMVNIVLKPKTMHYQNHNVYWNRTMDVYKSINCKAENWPENYALYFGRDKENPEFADSVAILTYMHFEDFGAWQDSFNTSAHPATRSKEYADLKEKKAAKLIHIVSQRFPEIAKNCKAYQVASPLTFRDYIGSNDGNLYGIAKNINDPKQSAVSVGTKIPNLLFTGQNAGIHGVLGVSITAITTCGHLLGLDYLVNKINCQ